MFHASSLGIKSLMQGGGNVSHVVFDIGVLHFVVKVTNVSTKVFFDKNNSFHDIRMGAFKNVKCGSCGANENDCPGHFGYIDLVTPVVNPMFVNKILRPVLNKVCMRCFKVDCGCRDQSKPKKRKKRKYIRYESKWKEMTPIRCTIEG